MEEEKVQNESSKETPKKGSNLLYITAAALLLIVLGGYALTKGNTSKTMTPTPTPSNQMMNNEEVGEKDDKTQESTTEPTSIVEQTSTIQVEGGAFYFKPNKITVKKGETVKITFNNVEGTHDFVLEEFDIDTPTIGAGKSSTVEFTADKAGTFEFYCSVGNHRAMGMKGILVVE